MSEPTTIARTQDQRIRAGESVGVIEAAPVEAELERLRKIEAAARPILAAMDSEFYDAHKEIRDALRAALEEPSDAE